MEILPIELMILILEFLIQMSEPVTIIKFTQLNKRMWALRELPMWEKICKSDSIYMCENDFTKLFGKLVPFSWFKNFMAIQIPLNRKPTFYTFLVTENVPEERCLPIKLYILKKFMPMKETGGLISISSISNPAESTKGTQSVSTSILYPDVLCYVRFNFSCDLVKHIKKVNDFLIYLKENSKDSLKNVKISFYTNVNLDTYTRNFSKPLIKNNETITEEKFFNSFYSLKHTNGNEVLTINDGKIYYSSANKNIIFVAI